MNLLRVGCLPCSMLYSTIILAISAWNSNCRGLAAAGMSTGFPAGSALDLAGQISADKR